MHLRPEVRRGAPARKGAEPVTAVRNRRPRHRRDDAMPAREVLAFGTLVVAFALGFAYLLVAVAR